MGGDPISRSTVTNNPFVRSDLSFLKQKRIARRGWLGKPLPNDINDVNLLAKVPLFDIIGTTVGNTYLT